MNTTLAPYLKKFVLVFFDDILIYSKTFEDHLQHIKLNFWLKISGRLSYLNVLLPRDKFLIWGHVISERGVARSTEDSGYQGMAYTFQC
jgi:hypothetical protein